MTSFCSWILRQPELLEFWTCPPSASDDLPPSGRVRRKTSSGAKVKWFNVISFVLRLGSIKRISQQRHISCRRYTIHSRLCSRSFSLLHLFANGHFHLNASMKYFRWKQNCASFPLEWSIPLSISLFFVSHHLRQCFTKKRNEWRYGKGIFQWKYAVFTVVLPKNYLQKWIWK